MWRGKKTTSGIVKALALVSIAVALAIAQITKACAEAIILAKAVAVLTVVIRPSQPAHQIQRTK